MAKSMLKAKAPQSPAAAAALAFQRSEVPGSKVGAGVRRALHSLLWHRDLEEAASAARQQGRPIVWVQALGELRGLT